MKGICVFCGSSSGSRPEYRAATEELGTELARRNNDWAHGFMRGMGMRHDG